MEPKYLIERLLHARTLKSKPMAILFEALRIELGNEALGDESLRNAYLSAFYRGFPTDQFHPQSIMGFYAPYAMRAFLSTSKFRQQELELGKTLYKFCINMPVQEVVDIRVFWGMMNGRPSLIRETLLEASSIGQDTQNTDYLLARLHVLNSIANNEVVDVEDLTATVSVHETKWDGLPWIKWQFDHIATFS